MRPFSRRSSALLFLALLAPLSGCANNGPATGGPDPGDEFVSLVPNLVFEAQVAIDPTHRGGEPSILVAPNGDYYASAPSGFVSTVANTVFDPTSAPAQGAQNRQSFIWKSTDKGATWRLLSKTPEPLPPMHGDATIGGADTDLAVDACGTIYFTDLWLGNIAVSHSDDQGATWSGTPITGRIPVLDRNWLAADTREGKCGVVYLLYQTFYSQLWVLKSTDKGMTWNQQVLVLDGTNKAGTCDGLPVPDAPAVCEPSPFQGGTYDRFDNDGPLIFDAKNNVLYFAAANTTASGAGFWFFKSTNEGKDWSRTLVKTVGPAGNIFPVVAVDQEGLVYVAYSARPNNESAFAIYVTKSSDQGEHWTPPRLVSGGLAGAQIFPWIVAGAPGRVAVAWYGANESANDPDHVKGDWFAYVSATSEGMFLNETWSAPVPLSSQPMHRGEICTRGLYCTTGMPPGTNRGNRNLADFFEIAINNEGFLVAAWSNDVDSAEDNISRPFFARQSEGFNFLQNETAPAPTP